MQVMIFGARTQLEIQTALIGYKGVTWCIVLITACGWEILYTRIGTCSNLIMLMLSSMQLLVPSLVDLFMLATLSEITTSSCLTILFFLMAPFCGANIMHFPPETAYLKTLYMMAKQYSKFGTSTK
jgi:hypothetical protein